MTSFKTKLMEKPYSSCYLSLFSYLNHNILPVIYVWTEAFTSQHCLKNCRLAAKRFLNFKFECRSRIYGRELWYEPYVPVVNKQRLQVFVQYSHTDMVEKIVHQLAQANQNLTGKFLKQFWKQARSKNKCILK